MSDVHLIIDHNMDCAMCGIRREFTEVEGFIDDSLTCERSITVDENGHHLGHTNAGDLQFKKEMSGIIGLYHPTLIQ